MVNPGNIITNENKNRYLGRLVKITELYEDNTKTDGNNSHFLKDLSKNLIFRIQTPFRDDDYYLNSYVKIKPIKHYNYDMIGRDEMFIEVPDTIDDIDYITFPYVVELVTGSGLSERMRSDNILTKSRERGRRRRLAVTEHPAETSALPIHSHIRSSNPWSFNSSVIVNTINGPVEVELPMEVMRIIGRYLER
jgi:hypothetical protein